MRGIYSNCHKLREFDLEIIKELCKGFKKTEISNKLYVDVSTVYYHIYKIKRLTGLNPLNKADLKELANTYLKG